MVLLSNLQSQFELLAEFWLKTLQEFLWKVVNFSRVFNEEGIAWLTFGKGALQEVQIFGEFETMIDFNAKFHMPEVRIGYDQFSKDARVDHPD